MSQKSENLTKSPKKVKDLKFECVVRKLPIKKNHIGEFFFTNLEWLSKTRLEKIKPSFAGQNTNQKFDYVPKKWKFGYVQKMWKFD